MRLLVGDDHVDVVGAAQAVVGDAQQAVGVGRQIDARHPRALVGDHVDEARVLMGEAVMILTPDGGADEDVERGNRRPPGNFDFRLLQPLGVLVHHRVDDVGERLVGVEQDVAAGEQIALHPALQRVLAQHLHHAAVGRELAAVGVFGLDFGEPGLAARLVDRLQAVGRGLVGAEDPEIVHVVAHHVAQELPEHVGVLDRRLPGPGDFDRVVAKIRHAQRLAQQAAVGVRIRADAAVSGRRERLQFGNQPALRVEQLLRPVTQHPLLEQLEMRGI